MGAAPPASPFDRGSIEQHAGYERLRIERQGPILRVTLNAPDKLNAVDRTMETELVRLFQDLHHDRRTDVVVLTGAGRAFSAGGDLDRGLEVASDPVLLKEEFDLARRFISTLLDVEQPIICRLNGDAIGLGATLALFCDLVIAADTARIGDPHVRVGLVAGDGGAIIWPLLVGYARAKQYLLGGDLLDAREAERIGLINFCVAPDALDATVEQWAQRFARGAGHAIQWTKATINIGLKDQAAKMLDAGLAYEALALCSDDHREAVRAFREKRKPVFNGR
jgi:enoyl-CoA hydratase